MTFRRYYDPARRRCEEFEVGPGAAGRRLDAFLVERLPDYSRNVLQRAVRAGRVTVDGRPARVAARLAPGVRIAVDLPWALPLAEVPWPGPPLPEAAGGLPPPAVELLHSDDWLAAVVKPAGLPVHPAAGTGPRSLLNALRTQLGADPGELAPAHRLDRETTGIVLFARSAQAARRLAAAFAEGLIAKTYLACVCGLPRPPSGLLAWPLREGGRRVQVDPDGKPARTRYRVLAEDAARGRALVMLRPLTGRKHQLRAHLAHAGWPIAGDPRYGAQSVRASRRRAAAEPAAAEPQLALLAWRLILDHPGPDGGRLRLRVPAPAVGALLAAWGFGGDSPARAGPAMR